MATLDLGKIKFVWRGAYDAATAYEVDDFVSFNGSSYVSKVATTGVTPGTDSTKWDLLAQGGDVINTTTTTGDIVVRSGGGLSRVAAGAAGTILSSNGTGTVPSYSSALALVNPTMSVSKLSYPKQNSNQDQVVSNICVTADGSVKVTANANSTYHGLGIATASVATQRWENVQLPRSATAYRAIRGASSNYVISTDGRLFATGSNTSGVLGQGISANSLTSSQANTTALLSYSEVVFPTLNYPDVGQSLRPIIVDVWAGNGHGAAIAALNDCVFAIDSFGFLWAWGNNASGQLGLGGTSVAGTNPTSPVRVPAFLPTTVPQNTAILQPAGTLVGKRIRVRKIMYGTSSSEIFAMVDPADVGASQSNLFVWGISGFASPLNVTGGAMTATSNVPINISTTALANLAVDVSNLMTETVVDFCVTVSPENNDVVGTAWNKAFIHVLTSNGRILASGKNINGELGIGSNSQNIGVFTNVAAPVGTWALPASWTNPASFTNNAYAGSYTVASFCDNLDKLDEVLVGNNDQRFAQTANGAWYAWGRQFANFGLLGIGNTTTAINAPTAFNLRDHDTAGVYFADTSIQYSSNNLTTANVAAGTAPFTISKVRTCSAHFFAVTNQGQFTSTTAIITSTGKYYSIAGNWSGVMGVGDNSQGRLNFAHARIGNSTYGIPGITDCRITNCYTQTASTDFSNALLTNSRGMLFGAGYNAGGSLGVMRNNAASVDQYLFKNLELGA